MIHKYGNNAKTASCSKSPQLENVDTAKNTKDSIHSGPNDQRMLTRAAEKQTSLGDQTPLAAAANIHVPMTACLGNNLESNHRV